MVQYTAEHHGGKAAVRSASTLPLLDVSRGEDMNCDDLERHTHNSSPLYPYIPPLRHDGLDSVKQGEESPPRTTTLMANAFLMERKLEGILNTCAAQIHLIGFDRPGFTETWGQG